jgi:AAA15 family ATPase/GTPase
MRFCDAGYWGSGLGRVIQRCHDNPEFRSWAVECLKNIDTGIENLVFVNGNDDGAMIIEDDTIYNLEYKMRSRRHFYNKDQFTEWDFEDESTGTQQFLSLLGSWYDLIKNGALIIIDELDRSLHPLLSRELLKMANDPGINKNGGQLIFTTHDTTLLDPTLLRRDQIYLTEKNPEGESRLYSLAEYSPRKDEALQKGYLAGRYGAIPFIGDLKHEAIKGK